MAQRLLWLAIGLYDIGFTAWGGRQLRNGQVKYFYDQIHGKDHQQVFFVHFVAPWKYLLFALAVKYLLRLL